MHQPKVASQPLASRWGDASFFHGRLCQKSPKSYDRSMKSKMRGLSCQRCSDCASPKRQNIVQVYQLLPMRRISQSLFSHFCHTHLRLRALRPNCALSCFHDEDALLRNFGCLPTGPHRHHLLQCRQCVLGLGHRTHLWIWLETGAVLVREVPPRRFHLIITNHAVINSCKGCQYVNVGGRVTICPDTV